MDGSKANHGRRGTPWRRIRARVLREEPVCYICNRAPSTQVDHVLPLSLRPDLAHRRDNLRGVCAPCNYRKGASLPREVAAAGMLCEHHPPGCGGPHSRNW